MKRIAKFVNDITNIPPEIISSQPKIELTGNSLLYIENHRGIKHLTDNEAVIKLSPGFFTVSGTGISVKEINKEHICLTGSFTSFIFDKI